MPNARARALRHNSTDAERALWRLLRSRRLNGAKFRRQYPIVPYIADFACFAARLIVEVDGGQHTDSTTDPRRTAWLSAQGWRVLRFWNTDVLTNADYVVATISAALAAPSPGPATPRRPLPEGEA